MDIKTTLKYFVYLYLFLIFFITIFMLNNISVKKEGFDINNYIQVNKKNDEFFTELSALNQNIGLSFAIAAINVTLIVLGVTLIIQFSIPIIGWIMAIGTISAIAASAASIIVLNGKMVKKNDPKTEPAANALICAIKTEIMDCESELREQRLLFDTLKYAFKTNKMNIKTKAKKLLRDLDQMTEMIHEIYFPYLNDPNIPMVKFYNDLKETRILFLTITDDHTLRKELDLKSSEIDITLLDSESINYYIKLGSADKNTLIKKTTNCNVKPDGQPSADPMKADITNFLIIITHNVGKNVDEMKCFVDEHIQKYPDSNKKRKHSISENNRKRMNRLFIKMKPSIDELLLYIKMMKDTINASGNIFKRRDELTNLIAEDKKLIKAIQAYIPPHFKI